MTTPIVRRGTKQPKPTNSSPKPNSMSLTHRRAFAWIAEVGLIVVSGIVPYAIGAFANGRSEFSRVPLNPVVSTLEREISRPLALPVNYANRNVSLPTNILWTIAAIAPLTLSCWQLYLLGKTGSTIPKRRFGVRVVSELGTSPGIPAVLVRSVVGRWGVPMSVAYILWRYSPAFPNLVILTGLAALALIGEATKFTPLRNRRAFHDQIAGTYTIDANKSFVSPRANQPSREQWNESDEEAAIASVVMSPDIRQSGLWRRMQQNPSITLFCIALLSMTAVLGTLVGTQIYIQGQENNRTTEENNRKQFTELEKRLKASSNASVEERQSTIRAIGTLNYSQSTQFLVDLLGEETNPVLLNSIQQALVNVGSDAIPDLKRKNQLLASELDLAGSSASEQTVRQQKLQVNQQAINKILGAYGGQLLNVDLSRSRLSQTVSSPTAFFNLVLDKVDLWGINFKGANLNQASFKGSRFRGPGADGRWDTYDDWVADLRQTSMKQANFSEANLSRVLLNKSDLSGATLNKANLSGARLLSANLSSAQLVGADLRGAILENASLTGADIGEAKLNEAEMLGAQLGRSIAIGAQLSYANLTKTNWQAADLSGAYLDHANLSNANLSATRLTNVILRSANLENASLRNADLSLADLQGANVAGADFQGAILSGSGTDPSEQFVQKPQIGVQSALIKGVDFTSAKNLDPKQLAYICTQGGIHPRCP